MNHLSLFSGIGGFDLAAEWAGMQTVGFVERDPFCQKVLAKHWPGVPIFGDIHDVTGKLIFDQCGPVDIISGGFPCQPYSVAGNRRGNEDDRALWPQMLRVIAECRPRWVVGENVTGVISLALDGVLASLEAEGYEAWTIVFPACAVGARHIRQRVFIVAHDAGSGRWDGAIQHERWIDQRTANTGDDGQAAALADAQCLRCTEVEQSIFNRKIVQGATGAITYRSQPRGREWWQVEPGMGRVAARVSGRVDRLRSLGNAVVPQQVYPIFKQIAEMEGAL